MNVKSTYSEQELLALLQQRSDHAFNYLYDHYSAALFGIINSIVPDKDIAGDVLQDVFVNVWKKIDSYQSSKGRLFTWMLNVARNAAIDKIRSKNYRDSMKNQPLPTDVDKAVGGAITHPNFEDVGLKKVLTKLNEDQRKLIDLSYFQGFTHEEISKALNIPLGTVKTRIRSALMNLRTMLQ